MDEIMIKYSTSYFENVISSSILRSVHYNNIIKKLVMLSINDGPIIKYLLKFIRPNRDIINIFFFKIKV